MTTYIAILRGINVSGHKMIKMDALRELCTTLQFKNTQTYIQSGNIVFQYQKVKEQKLTETIKAAILKQFGFEVPVIVIEYDEWKKVIKDNPFTKDKAKDPAYLHVTFLADIPDAEKAAKLTGEKYPGEEIRIIGKAVYLYCPNGYGNAKLTNSFLESKLKVMATTRNWKTTNELARIAEEIID
jgi:uncharacterized protein (DUF1697 family)